MEQKALECPVCKSNNGYYMMFDKNASSFTTKDKS
jgi:hypothetical protein